METKLDHMTGKKFEALIKESCELQGLCYTRLKDAGWQGEDTVRRFTQKNVCDCIIFNGETLFFCEAKVRQKSIRFDELTQQKDLLEKLYSTKLRNVRAGYLMLIDGFCFYISAEKIHSMMLVAEKKSINSRDIALNGEIAELFTPDRARKPRIDIAALFDSAIS